MEYITKNFFILAGDFGEVSLWSRAANVADDSSLIGRHIIMHDDSLERFDIYKLLPDALCRYVILQSMLDHRVRIGVTKNDKLCLPEAEPGDTAAVSRMVSRTAAAAEPAVPPAVGILAPRY